MNEQEKYEAIKKLVETDGSVKRTALKLGCSVRTIYNHIRGYKEQGKEYFVHGNRGRKPSHTIPTEERERLIQLYKEEYYDQSYAHFRDSLEKDKEATVSTGFIRALLMSQYILSPKSTRSTKKRFKKELKEQQRKTKTKKERNALQERIVDVEEAHARRPRCKHFGELLQMDASLHCWFGPDKATLHLAIDDSSSRIVGAYFDKEETLNGYYQVTKQILLRYGIPYRFLTDRRTVFEYQAKGKTYLEEDTFTQFGYACHRLGIDIRTSSVAQAKGRVERAFGSLQGRLPSELRRTGVTTIEQANVFLNSYIKEYNDMFALDIDDIPSVFETQPEEKEIDLILSVLTERTIDSGHSIRFENSYYRLVNDNGLPVHYHKGTKGLVIKTMDQRLFFTVHETVYALEEIPKHQVGSRNFDLNGSGDRPKKKHIPPMSHPWKAASFQRYVAKQKHRQEHTA